MMSMAQTMTPGTYRTNTEILTRRGGGFWGLVLFLLGLVWLLQTIGVIDLGENAINVVIPFLLIVAGMYLLVGKVMR